MKLKLRKDKLEFFFILFNFTIKKLQITKYKENEYKIKSIIKFTKYKENEYKIKSFIKF